MPIVHSLLRSTKHQFSGHLILTEILRGDEDEKKESDYFGPTGLNRGEVESREHDSGKLHGDLAVINDYHPVKELEWVTRQLESIDGLPSEEAAMNFICEMTDQQRRAAVAILETVDKGVIKFSARVQGFPFVLHPGEHRGRPRIRDASPKSHLIHGDFRPHPEAAEYSH